MSFVWIFVNKSFTFLVYGLTFLQSWFLRESNVVFLSDMIFSMICSFIFSSSVNVSASVFAMYRSLSFSFWFGLSDCPVFSASATVNGVCWCIWLYICWRISSISRSEDQQFFVIVLTWSASIRFVDLNLPNSVQISIILFLYSLY